MRMVLKIHKKGILIIPKRIRGVVGFEEDSEVIAEVIGNSLVLRPLKPRVVDVDPRLVEKLLREEYELEKQRYRRMVSGEKDRS